MTEKKSDPYLVLKINTHGCTYEEAEYLIWVNQIMGLYLQIWQEAALLELRRAHREGRTPFIHPYERKNPRADFYSIDHSAILRSFRDHLRSEKEKDQGPEPI